MVIHEASENYLEAILMLKNKKGYVRSIDIANHMHHSKPTISVAIKNLRENGYVSVDESGFISLEEKGKEIADKIYERHEIIAQILMHLGVDEETAYKDSCKIEHDLSDVTFERIKEYYAEHLDKNETD